MVAHPPCVALGPRLPGELMSLLLEVDEALESHLDDPAAWSVKALCEVVDIPREASGNVGGYDTLANGQSKQNKSS